MTSAQPHIHLLLFAGLLAVTLGACDNAGPLATGNGVPTTLRVQVSPSTALTGGTLATTNARGGPQITLDEVKLLVKTVKFYRAEDEEETEFHSDAVAVTLDLGGEPTTIAVADVPPDAYRRVTFVIHKPEDTEPIPDPDFRDSPSGNDRYSVIVSGTVDGAPFVLKVRDSIQQRIEFNPALVVSEDGGPVDVTLLTDVAAWFVSDSGQPLDPRDENDADEIADRIDDSFGALGD